MDDSILNKPGELTDSEWEEIKRHPEVGYRILSTVNHMSQMLAGTYSPIMKDGTAAVIRKACGERRYPCKARVIQILDAYESMTSDRSYRNAP